VLFVIYCRKKRRVRVREGGSHYIFFVPQIDAFCFHKYLKTKIRLGSLKHAYKIIIIHIQPAYINFQKKKGIAEL
jgi:hypothetical protein